MTAPSTTLSRSRPLPWRQDDAARGRTSPRWSLPRALPRPPARWLPALVSAALLLVTLGIAGYSTLDRDDGGRPGGLAIMAPASPSPSADADDVLLEVPLPADVVPEDGFGDLSFVFYTMPARSSSTWDATTQAANPGLWADYLLSGAMTMTAQEAVDVIRAGTDGTPETLPAGTEITLEPGDAVLHHSDVAKEWSNAGSAPVELLSIIIRETPWTPPRPTGWQEVRFDDQFPAAIPAGDWLVRLEVLELEPDAVIPGPTGKTMHCAVVVPGSEAYLVRGTGDVLRLADATATTTVYLFTLESTGGGATPEA